MLQATPEGTVDVDDWERLSMFLATVEDFELVDVGLAAETLLWRLFHEEGVRVYDTHPVEARCRCSRERVAGILRAFPADEVDEMKQEAVTTVTCEFCNTRYDFTAAELERLAQV
jgi:molecular chaperone Hsp33